MINLSLDTTIAAQAKSAGLFVDSSSHGSEYIRYRFFHTPAQYSDEGSIFTAFGKAEARAFLTGYTAANQ